MTHALAGTPFDDDKLREECGVVGVYGHPEAAALVALGLHALQHRGQEGVGIVSFDGARFHAERHMGLVADHFDKGSGAIDRLHGMAAVGHVRYSTAGGSNERNVQPLYADLALGGVAIAHNGNLTNAETLRRGLVAQGSIFQSTSDTEVILHLIAQSAEGALIERMKDSLRRIEGAYSLIALTTKKLVGMRDPLGVRPLVLGKLGTALVLASESCALDIMGATYVRDVQPGEMLVISDNRIESLHPFPQQKRRFCVFEYVYFARPDSTVEGRNVYDVRKRIGAELALESPVGADVVVPVPDSGVPAAIGYAQEAGIPFEFGIIRNHYVGRTFIQPSQDGRDAGVKMKHSPNRAQIAGKRIVLVDDSIVRGTTSKKIVQMLREAGAAEVHMRIASPPTKYSCFYGVDTPEQDKLLAHRMSIAGMCEWLGADSLAFISMDGLYRAAGEAGRNAETPQFCDACFSGDYPTRLTDKAVAQAENEPRRQLTLLDTR